MTRAARGASLALALGACGIPALGPRPPRARTVLLVTVDTLRPDALGWIGGTNGTPTLDALAREGLRFRAAVSGGPADAPSHTSIMSALLPRHHGVRDNGQVVARGLPLLAERMKAAGLRDGRLRQRLPVAQGVRARPRLRPVRGHAARRQRGLDGAPRAGHHGRCAGMGPPAQGAVVPWSTTTTPTIPTRRRARSSGRVPAGPTTARWPSWTPRSRSCARACRARRSRS